MIFHFILRCVLKMKFIINLLTASEYENIIRFRGKKYFYFVLLSKLVTTVIYHLFLESNITHSFLILISLLVFSMIIRNNNLYSDSVFKEEYPNTFTIIIFLLFDRRNIPSNFVCPVLLQRFYLYPFLLLTLFA